MKQKKVTMVTKNQYKVAAMKKVLDTYDIELEIENFEVPEIQADSCEEVAKFSAQYAANKCGKAIIKVDVGLFIEALGGLPGVYTSPFEKKLGPQKVLKLMEGETNRKAKIVYALAYCEPKGESIVFSSDCSGLISREIRGKEGMLIGYIFIPKGQKLTMAELRDMDSNKARALWGKAKKNLLNGF
jgi:XTP/dITP diphosphohydrolase